MSQTWGLPSKVGTNDEYQGDFDDNDVSAAARLGRSLEKEIAASYKVPSMQSQERQNHILER